MGSQWEINSKSVGNPKTYNPSPRYAPEAGSISLVPPVCPRAGVHCFDFEIQIKKIKSMDPGSTAYRDDVKELRSFQLTAN